MGSRVDEPGPFLPESAMASEETSALSTLPWCFGEVLPLSVMTLLSYGLTEEGPDDYRAPRAMGPERPVWLPRESQDASPNGAMPRTRESLRSRARNIEERSGSQEKQRKGKKKKKKKEKRHKEKRRKKAKD